MSVERITKKQALRAARSKLPLLGDKKLQENLDFAVGGCCSRCSEARALAEAYRIGAEEAQGIIAKRIDAIGAAKVTTPKRQRCPARSPGGSSSDGQLPATGTQCGLEAGHDGDHSILIPTGAPWFPKGTTP